jgi:cholest-4-en-3-one 26-monooxygenase
VFEDPFRFDIARDPNPHIAFGGGGPHFCLGSQLARMEIHVLFEELARRTPRVEALGPAERLRSNFIGGIKHLPVRFHPS